jgi:hypothetical protein
VSDYDYDVDYIPTLLLGETRPRARREHTCSICSKMICPFTVYRRRFYLVDGQPTVEKVCSYCEENERGHGS